MNGSSNDRRRQSRRPSKLESKPKTVSVSASKSSSRNEFEQLLADADQLRQAQAIRAYVAEVAELYGSQSAPTEGATFHEWRAWALAQADRIDPVKNGRFLKSVKDRN